MVADVSSAGGLERLFEAMRGALGAPAILVANARGPPSGTPTRLSGWEEAYKLTLMSFVRLVQHVLLAVHGRD